VGFYLVDRWEVSVLESVKDGGWFVLLRYRPSLISANPSSSELKIIVKTAEFGLFFYRLPKGSEKVSLTHRLATWPEANL
ncbi:uncharacterized protein METZ01_LOCUS514453, partial [marine metagenome]